MDEYWTFRYRLDGARREPIHSDRLAEMVRQQLLNILDVAQPLRGGADAAPDAFRFLGPERRAHELHGGGSGKDTLRGSYEGESGRGSEGGAGACRPGVETASAAGETAGGGGRESRCPGRVGKCARGGGSGNGECIPYANLANAALYEPRIEFIARQLASLLAVVELESGGEAVEVDGFRLRDLEDWTGPHVSTPADIFNHAATACRFDCVFCYNRGLPPSLREAPGEAEDGWGLLQRRVELYNPRARRGLFPTFGSPREVLAHPRILPLLRALRARTEEPFRLCTSGWALDRDLTAALAELAPVYLDLSLNSSSPVRRALLMGDREPERAIAAPALLAEAGIPFAVTVVAWPLPDLEGMLEDLERTAAFAAAAGARMVQVNLPGYSSFFCEGNTFDTELVWGETVRAVQGFRDVISCPVVVSPSLYEENLTRERKNRPEVTGVVANSPAARWGLAAGDTITAVNGIAVNGRPQARDLLALVQVSGGKGAITVTRGGRELELAGDTADWSYPFDPATGTHLGAVFMGAGLRAAYLESLEALVRESGSRETLFLTSTLVRPTLEQLLRERPLTLPRGCRLRLGVPGSRYFGGNIMLGDLLTVEDFIGFLSDYTAASEVCPDLVIIPSSPFHMSGWGRDLTGRPYQDIERETGLRVRLLACNPVWE